uniref:OTU domain-containing protein n=1 Tax=Aegilops tauschii subsp. strangulata TaxID=200361 RepID=A0A453MJU7_AEGTS
MCSFLALLPVSCSCHMTTLLFVWFFQYGVKIFILTSFRDTCYIEILPVVQKSNRVICLSFWAEVHYNSIYPEGGIYSLFYHRIDIILPFIPLTRLSQNADDDLLQSCPSWRTERRGGGTWSSRLVVLKPKGE